MRVSGLIAGFSLAVLATSALGQGAAPPMSGAALPKDLLAKIVVDAMVAGTNARLPPGVRRASADGSTMVMEFIRPAAANPETFANELRRGSVDVTCKDPDLRKAMTEFGVTLRISVDQPGSRPVTRDIVAADCGEPPSTGTAPDHTSTAEPAPTPPGPVMTATELEAIAQQVRRFVPKDRFDAPPKLESLAGRRFSYTVQPRERGLRNEICDGYASWGYWPADGKLEVGDTEGMEIKSDLKSATGTIFPESGAYRSDPFVSFRSFTCEKKTLPSYTATNGFGAAVDVFPTSETVTAIAHAGSSDTEWRTYVSLKADGEEARTLSRNVRVRVSGSLDDWAPGKPVLCGVSKSRPTTDRPWETTLDACLFKGRVDLFEVIDARDGRVLYSNKR